MEKIILLIILLNSFCLNAFSQGAEYPDSPYERPYLVDYKKEHPYDFTKFGNANIRLSDSLLVDSLELADTAWKAILNKYSFTLPPITNSVLFEPIKNYYKNVDEKNSHTYYLYDYVKKYDDKMSQFYSTLPNSLPLYVDTNNVKIVPNKVAFELINKENIPLEKYLRPFYISKYEVSNYEYREFVNYVKDSIIREFLVQQNHKEYGIKTEYGTVLNMSVPIDYADTLIQNNFYVKGDERFYRKRFFDINLLKYHFQNSDSSIYVYPDTLCWLDRHEYSYGEPMNAMYFWHPAYDYYPVVGVSYYQALAFLDWKTKMEQAKLNAQGVNVKVTYTLPNYIEWDIVTTAYSEEYAEEAQIYGEEYFTHSSSSWITDLQLQDVTVYKSDTVFNNSAYSITDKTEINFVFENIARKDFLPLKFSAYNNVYLANPLYISHYLNKWEVFWAKKKKPSAEYLQYCDENGIYFLGANLSEWLLDSYKEQWKPLFDLRQQQLQQINTRESLLLSQIEMYYDSFNAQNGKLVCGSNWFDNRHESLNKGKNAKIFANPSQGYSTVGFRYVVHVEKK